MRTISSNFDELEQDDVTGSFRPGLQQRISERLREYRRNAWAAALEPPQHSTTSASRAATAVKQLSRAVKH